jgi:hypothetical protein
VTAAARNVKTLLSAFDFKDPAGNRVGLVEMENGKPKIPSVK